MRQREYDEMIQRQQEEQERQEQAARAAQESPIKQTVQNIINKYDNPDILIQQAQSGYLSLIHI